MKAIIYYSLSGHTKRILEEKYQGDFYRIKGKIKIPRKYWVQLIYLGFFASIGKKLKYQPLDIDFDLYDEIVIGSPVWAFTIAPFMKRFLKEHPFKNKKVTLLITHEGGPGNALKHYKRYLEASNVIISEASIKLGSHYEDATIIQK